MMRTNFGCFEPPLEGRQEEVRRSQEQPSTLGVHVKRVVLPCSTEEARNEAGGTLVVELRCGDSTMTQTVRPIIAAETEESCNLDINAFALLPVVLDDEQQDPEKLVSLSIRTQGGAVLATSWIPISQIPWHTHQSLQLQSSVGGSHISDLPLQSSVGGSQISDLPLKSSVEGSQISAHPALVKEASWNEDAGVMCVDSIPANMAALLQELQKGGNAAAYIQISSSTKDAKSDSSMAYCIQEASFARVAPVVAIMEVDVQILDRRAMRRLSDHSTSSSTYCSDLHYDQSLGGAMPGDHHPDQDLCTSTWPYIDAKLCALDGAKPTSSAPVQATPAGLMAKVPQLMTKCLVNMLTALLVAVMVLAVVVVLDEESAALGLLLNSGSYQDTGVWDEYREPGTVGYMD